MPYRTTVLATGEYYHVYNRGVAYQPVFKNKWDYERFLATISYYRFQNTPLRLSKVLQMPEKMRESFLTELNTKGSARVDIVAYCLMPNHFHFLVKQAGDGGISTFFRLSINSYAKYFNTKYKRAGSLFQDMFKAVRIETDEQLIHVSRYIHLNPLVSYLVRREGLVDYPWSSLHMYSKDDSAQIITADSVLSQFKNSKEYLQFVLDQEDYGKKFETIKHLMFEET